MNPPGSAGARGESNDELRSAERCNQPVRKRGLRLSMYLGVMALVIAAGCGGSGDQKDGVSESADIPLEITMPVARTAAETGGAIQGSVLFDGTPPVLKTFVPNKDTEVCGTSERVSGDVVIGANLGIKHVVVSIVNAPKTEMDTSVKGMIDQKGCLFTPRIAQVAVGAPMVFLNNDNIFHNIHSNTTINLPFNKAQPGFMKRITETFAQPEIIEVFCDVHSWMKGWIVVQDHPYYAVTDENGAFTIPHVPPGAYTIRFWHETFGEQTVDVTVVDQETATADMMFSE